jgi:hypothetical protein
MIHISILAFNGHTTSRYEVVNAMPLFRETFFIKFIGEKTRGALYSYFPIKEIY